MSKIFFSRVRELIGDKPVVAFAQLLEMPQTTVNSYIIGKRKPSVELIERICLKCGVTSDWLLGLSNERERESVVAPKRNVIEMSFSDIKNATSKNPTVRQ